MSHPGQPVDRLWSTSRWLVHAGVVAAVAMQVVRGDFFPPENSMSQYGVGRDGWIFSASVMLLGLGSLGIAAASRARPTAPPVSATIMLAVWATCLMLAGIVPADASASAPTMAGHTHMILSGLALLTLPLAGLLHLHGRSSHPAMTVRVIGSMLVAVSELSLLLLLLTNFDLDITGLGQREAWALYQSIAVVADIAILYFLARRPRAGIVRKTVAARAADGVR